MESKFQLSISAALACLFAIAAIAASIGAVFIIPVDVPLSLVFQIFAAAAVMVLFVVAARHHAFLRGNRAVRAIAFLSAGNVEITANNGIFVGQLKSVFALPILAVFVVDGGNRQIFNVMVAFDSLPADSHRQLRVQLLCAPKSPSPPTYWQRSKDYFCRKTD